MPDYISRWSGNLIDKGVDMALNSIGCYKYPSTLDRPLDLNKLHGKIQLEGDQILNATGSWLVEYYINGPIRNITSTNSTNYTPVIVDVSIVDNYTYQSIMNDGIFYYRYGQVGKDITSEWSTIAYPRLEIDVGTSGSLIKIIDPRIELIDLLFIMVKIKNDIRNNAEVKINDYSNIPIFTTDNQPIREGIKADSIIQLIYNKTNNRFYYSGGNGTKWIDDNLDIKADKAAPPITTNVNKAITKVTVNEQGIVTKAERANSSDIDHGDGTLEDELDNIHQTIINSENSAISFIVEGDI